MWYKLSVKKVGAEFVIPSSSSFSMPTSVGCHCHLFLEPSVLNESSSSGPSQVILVFKVVHMCYKPSKGLDITLEDRTIRQEKKTARKEE